MLHDLPDRGHHEASMHNVIDPPNAYGPHTTLLLSSHAHVDMGHLSYHLCHRSQISIVVLMALLADLQHMHPLGR